MDFYNVGVVIDFFDVEKLAPGLGLELHRATYDPLQPGAVDHCFCNISSPAYVSTVVVHQGGNLDPVQQCDAIEVLSSRFLRGDTNLDGFVDVGDAIATLTYLFGPPVEPCQLAMDANDDELFDIADAVTTLYFLFSNGPPFPPPTGSCGLDPTPGVLSCVTPPPCP